MDRQTAIDRITETENLTAGLEDDDANWLLDCGIARIDGLLAGAAGEDAAGEKINQLMAVMRTLNQIAANRAAKAPDALATDIRAFLARHQQTFGASSKNDTPVSAPPADAKTTPGATAPKDGRGPSAANQTATPPATRPIAPQPPAPGATPAPTSTPPDAAKKIEAGQSRPTKPAVANPPASDQSTQAAGKIAAMTPRDAMRYLLSLADSSSVAS
jgi:hypothetical protein